MLRHLIVSDLLACIFVFTACGTTTLRSTGAFPSAMAAAEGLSYHLGRDVIVVNAQVITTTEWEPAAPEELCTVAAAPKPVRVAWELQAVTVPDRRFTYRLGIVQKGSAEQDVKLGVSEQGLLTALNYESRDRTADIVANVAKGIAGVAGTALGLVVPTDPAFAGRSFPVGDDECFRRSNRGRADSLAENIRSARRGRDAVRHDRDRLSSALATARSSEALRRLAIQDSLLERREKLLDDRVGAAVSAQVTALRTFRELSGIREDTVRVTETFDLIDVPRNIADAMPLDQVTHALAQSQHAGAPDRPPSSNSSSFQADSTPAQRLFARTGLVITTSSVREPATGGAPPERDTLQFGCAGGDRDDPCTKIYFRQPVMREVRIYRLEGDRAAARLQLEDVRRIPLVSSEDRERYVAFRGKKMGRGKINLVFGSRGNLIGLEQSSNAPLADATATLSAGLTGARQEFLSGLQAVQTTQSAMAAIQDNSRNARIEQLKDQKAVIDAQVALDGAEASQELLAEKQYIDAQLALLQSQQDLALASSRAASADAVADMRAELERLKLELELIQKRLEVEKAR